MSLLASGRCPMPSLSSSVVEVWPERGMSGMTERLSQVRRRGHDEEPAAVAAVEVVSIASNAACGSRAEPRRRRCRLLPVLLASLVLIIVVGLFYAADYQPLESASQRARRMHDAKRRLEEAEYTKQLWADVLRRRLQEQAAIGRPRYAPAAAQGGVDDAAAAAATAGRDGAAAAELGANDDREDVDDNETFAPPSTSAAPSFASPLPSPPAVSSSAPAVAGDSFSNIRDAPLRVPPKGIPHDSRSG